MCAHNLGKKRESAGKLKNIEGKQMERRVKAEIKLRYVTGVGAMTVIVENFSSDKYRER